MAMLREVYRAGVACATDEAFEGMQLRLQEYNASDELVVEAFKWLAKAHSKERPRRLSVEEKSVGVDSGGQEPQPIQPGGVGDGKVVADAPGIAGTKKSPILAFA
jgi:hypothetical protein